MTAPRMRIAVYGSSPAGLQLADGLAAAGHKVLPLRQLEGTGAGDGVADAQCVILAVSPGLLPRVVELVAPHVRDGQIFIHTSLAQGVQVLDDLETRGAIVIAAAPVSVDRWAVTFLDELGGTIAGLLLGELGATGIEVPDAERALLAARVTHAQMLGALAAEAAEGVRRMMDADTTVGIDADHAQAIAAYPAVKDPGERRAFVEAARRYAEIEEIQELELWAIQEDMQ